MIKITGTAWVAAAMLISSAAFAEDAGCCAKGASKEGKTACADLTALHLTANQKTKIETWQTECLKAGCTTQSKARFLKQAKGILSNDQYAKLKTECEKGAAKKTQT